MAQYSCEKEIVLKILSIAARQRKDYQNAHTHTLAALEIAARTNFNDLNISAISVNLK